MSGMDKLGDGWMGRLAGQVCAITGGASGIGAGIAARAVREGAHVVVLDIDADKAGAAAEDLRQAGSAEALQLDVTDGPAFQVALQKISDAHGRLDVLINNAGIPGSLPLESITRQAFDRIMAINVYGIIAGTQAFAALALHGRCGKIINMCSIQSRQAAPGHALYAASKFAVRALTLSFAQELGPHGIRVNGICPGIIDTPIWQDIEINGVRGFAAAEPLIKNSVALGYGGTPDDVASAAVYLASRDGDYVTGQFLTVDGGIVFS